MIEFVCFNGSILQEKEVKISPLNRGIMYGDGCFETFKGYSGRFLHIEKNFKRLCEAALYLKIDIKLTLHQFYHHVIELIEANQHTEKQVIIRFQCWRKGKRGYKTENSGCNWVITSQEILNHKSKPVQLIIAETPAIPTNTLNRRVKLSNGINYIIAAQEAIKKNAEDALMLTVNGYISETTNSNIFWGKGDSMYTPSLDCDLLPGFSRNLIINMLKNNRYTLKIGQYTVDDIMNADFAFTTNSISEIRSVESIDDTIFSSKHNVIATIYSLFEVEKNRMLKK